VICAFGVFRLRDIKDGASCTYLAGEKYVSPDAYFNGQDSGADQCWDEGLDDDINRITSWSQGKGAGPAGPVGSSPQVNGYYYPPQQDQPGVLNGPANTYVFGSAHANSFNMVFCDGSVQAIPYTIDPAIHEYLGSRNDRHTVNVNKLY
jgi:prepilin-type processing-associated H-X9-DG protein